MFRRKDDEVDLDEEYIIVILENDRANFVGLSSKFNLRKESRNRLIDDAQHIQRTSGFSERYVYKRVHDATNKSYGKGLPLNRLKIICEELEHMPPELNFKYKLFFRTIIDEKTFHMHFDFVLQYNYMSKGKRKRECRSVFQSNLYRTHHKPGGGLDYDKLFDTVKFVEYVPKKR